LIQVEQEKVAKKEEDIQRMRYRRFFPLFLCSPCNIFTSFFDSETVQAQKEAEVAKINAEKLSTISTINLQKEISEKEAEKKKRAIDDEIFLSHKRAMTDAEHYELTKRAEANKAYPPLIAFSHVGLNVLFDISPFLSSLYSEEYLRFVLYTSLANNTKIYFGNIFSLSLFSPSPLCLLLLLFFFFSSFSSSLHLHLILLLLLYPPSSFFSAFFSFSFMVRTHHLFVQARRSPTFLSISSLRAARTNASSPSRKPSMGKRTIM